MCMSLLEFNIIGVSVRVEVLFQICGSWNSSHELISLDFLPEMSQLLEILGVKKNLNFFLLACRIDRIKNIEDPFISGRFECKYCI